MLGFPPYPLRVQVLHGLGDCVEHSAGLSLGEELLLEDPIQQLSAAHQLGHQEHLLAAVVHLRQNNTRTSVSASLTGTRYNRARLDLHSRPSVL